MASKVEEEKVPEKNDDSNLNKKFQQLKNQ